MKKLLAIAASSLAIAGSSHAVVLIDSFDSYTPEVDNSPLPPTYTTINGQGGWSVAGDPTPVAVATVDGSEFYWGADPSNTALIGGDSDGSTGAAVTMSHGLSQDIVSATAQLTSFSVEVGLGSGAYSPRDTFSFRLSDGTFANSFSLVFSPLNTDEWTVSWATSYEATLAGGVQSTPITTINSLDSLTPEYYKFTTTFWATGTDDVAVQITDGFNSWNGLMLEAGSETWSTFEATWSRNGGAGSGLETNYMAFDNLAVVPEPSAAALLALGAAIGLRRRRQA